MGARRRFTKLEPATTSPSPRLHMSCCFWVVLTVLLCSSGASSAKYTTRSEEGKCRYDLTSIATLSCVLPDGVWRPPSHSCCNALLYAIDQVPPSDVSGACCLCRYLKEKLGPSKLATTYVTCNGEDKHIVTEWSFPITTCSDDCGQGIISSLGMEHEDTPAVQAHGTGKEEQEHEHVSSMGHTQGTTTKVIWVAVVVFIVIWLICFWYFRRSFKAEENASEPRSGRRRSVGPSSAKRKEKRLSSP